MMITTTSNHSDSHNEPEFELEASLSFEEILEDDKSYAGAQPHREGEKQQESEARVESAKQEIIIVHEIGISKDTYQETQLSFLPEEKPEMTLPAVLCDEELLREIANIPERLAFKIGDVADMLGIKQYVLRYWESEFELLKPKKASNNQRMYSKKDVENAFLIRKLLHRDRFSIEGARQALRALKSHVKKEKTEVQAQNKMNQKILSLNEKLEDLVQEISRIKALFQ